MKHVLHRARLISHFIVFVDVTSVNSLNEVTIGMLVAKSGVPAPLPMERDNFFLKTKDQSYYDASTGRLCFSTRSQLRLYYNCTQHLLTGLCYCQLELVCNNRLFVCNSKTGHF